MMKVNKTKELEMLFGCLPGNYNKMRYYIIVITQMR